MNVVQPIRDRHQVNRMKRHLKQNNLRDFVIFTLGVNSGMRIGDILDLTVADVLNEEGNVRDRVSLRESKTNKSKDFPLSDNVKQAVREYLDNRSYSPEEPLFPSRKGDRPITRQSVWRIFDEAAKSVGIRENIGTHTLRKTFDNYTSLVECI